jgi:hypothetical protein
MDGRYGPRWGDRVSATGLDRACEHPDFMATVEVIRRTETEGGPISAYTTSIRINCVACDEPFRFIGVQAGDMPGRPMCSVDEAELRAPIRPASSDPDFGLGIPGFSVRFKEPS